MTLTDRRFIHRHHAGSQEDNVVVPPIDIDVPPPPVPVDPPDPVDPPVVRGNHGQQVSAQAHARNAARKELHGKTVIPVSADPSKVRIDKVEGTQIFLTILDEDAIIDITGTVDGVSIPTILVTGPTTPVNPIYADMIDEWDADNFIDNGSKITALVGKKNGNNLTQATDANRAPLSAVATVGGKQVIQLTGGYSYNIDPLTNGVMPPITDISLGAICKPTAVIQKLAIQVGTDGTAKGIGLSPDTSSGNFGILNNGVEWVDTEDLADAVAKHFYLVNRNGSVTRFYKDGKPLFPIYNGVIGTPYTKVGIPGNDHLMAGDWRLGLLGNSLTYDQIKALALYYNLIEGTPDNRVLTANFAADDAFATGATIDTAGTRATGATPWTAFNAGGGLINAVSGGQLHLTLPQAASAILRGFSQPDPNAGTIYSYFTCKIIPANLSAQDGHHFHFALYDIQSDRIYTIRVGHESGGRHIDIATYLNVSTSMDFNSRAGNVTGFSASDFNKEWTLHFAWNVVSINAWFQIDNGTDQYLYHDSGGFFNSGTRGDKIIVGVSSGNAAGGNTVADITDFKRVI